MPCSAVSPGLAGIGTPEGCQEASSRRIDTRVTSPGKQRAASCFLMHFAGHASKQACANGLHPLRKTPCSQCCWNSSRLKLPIHMYVQQQLTCRQWRVLAGCPITTREEEPWCHGVAIQQLRLQQWTCQQHLFSRQTHKQQSISGAPVQSQPHST